MHVLFKLGHSHVVCQKLWTSV